MFNNSSRASYYVVQRAQQFADGIFNQSASREMKIRQCAQSTFCRVLDGSGVELYALTGSGVELYI